MSILSQIARKVRGGECEKLFRQTANEISIGGAGFGIDSYRIDIKEASKKIKKLHKVTEVALISFAGLRFETQIKLQLEDLLDYDIKTMAFTRTPALIHIPAEKHKAGKRYGTSYFSLLTKEGCEIVEAYLKNRRAKKEKLTETSYVIGTLQGNKIMADAIRRNLLKMTHDVLGTRAYVLRSYFNTSLLAAGIHPDWKRFFTGHKGDIEDIYSTRKILPEWAIEKMREHFQPAVKQLTTTKPDIQEQEKAAAIAALKVIQGYSDNLGINKESLKEIKHQLEAPQPA